jgi:hypothetical protein
MQHLRVWCRSFLQKTITYSVNHIMSISDILRVQDCFSSSENQAKFKSPKQIYNFVPHDVINNAVTLA